VSSLRSSISCAHHCEPRVNVMNMLQKLHDLGLVPHAPEALNLSSYILEDASKSRFNILNLSDCELHPVCPKDMHDVDWANVKQTPRTICQSLTERAYEMDFWCGMSCLLLLIQRGILICLDAVKQKPLEQMVYYGLARKSSHPLESSNSSFQKGFGRNIHDTRAYWTLRTGILLIFKASYSKARRWKS
jgi:hypothetical protein